MTQIAIKTQIAAIDKATKQAIKTKATAIKFLMDAGILTQSDNKKAKNNLPK